MHTFGQENDPQKHLENWVKTWQPTLMPTIFIGAMARKKSTIVSVKNWWIKVLL